MGKMYGRYEFSSNQLYNIKQRFPGWLIDSYRNVKNNKNVQKDFRYEVKEVGKPKTLKWLKFDNYVNEVFPKLYNYIENYNSNRKCQSELLNELYKIIHLRINYTRCIEVIYNDLVVLERKQANRLEIQDILNTTNYKKYVVAYSQIGEEFKRINKDRGRGNALEDDERKIMIHNKELDIINYVGSLIGKKPLTWSDVETAREEHKRDNYDYKIYMEENKKLKLEVERLQNIIKSLGGKY